jgi:hypothetical protein
MLDQRPSPPKDLASVFFRAMGLAWPVQLGVVVSWLLIPHPSGAHPLVTLLIAVAAGLVCLPMLHPAADAGNRVLCLRRDARSAAWKRSCAGTAPNSARSHRTGSFRSPSTPA